MSFSVVLRIVSNVLIFIKNTVIFLLDFVSRQCVSSNSYRKKCISKKDKLVGQAMRGNKEFNG